MIIQDIKQASHDTCICVCWNALVSFQRTICGPVKDKKERRIWRSYVLYSLYENMNIIFLIKLGRLKWEGHVQMDKQRPAKIIINAKPEEKRKKEGLN
jgi:hypothetical protein